jgi:tetratricopeptide (TPR) repeat protein
MDNHPMAAADFSRAIEIQPDPVAFFNRGLSRQALGQHAEAIDDFDNTLGFRPDAPEVYQAKGLSELALQKYENAFDDFYKAAQGSKNNYQAWALRGQAAEAMGARKEAARAYQRALQINPGFRPAREGLNRVGSEA